MGQEEDETIIEKTVPIATLYSNFHTQINGDNLGFDVERVYLGFKTQLNKNYAIIMKLDIGSPDGSALLGGVQYQPETFIKVALSYRDWVPYPPNLAARRFIFLNLEVKI